MSRDVPGGTQKPWDNFYARTMHLPSPQLTKNFIDQLPAHARVLDFGAGSGAWTAAFLRDRPDLTIDALDMNIDQAMALPEKLNGQKLQLCFQEYKGIPDTYDAIWARSALFFLHPRERDDCFHELAKSLPSKGLLSFTMVDDVEKATLAKFHGMSEPAILTMLDKEGLELVSISRITPPYGPTRIIVPTFDISARKK
jgi:cyclopropane fatty-acyl-phospholipid synthase-like methyltransferase